MSNSEIEQELSSLTNTEYRYVGYKTDYNDDLFNIVDQHKNKTIAEDLVLGTAKKIIDELNNHQATLKAVAKEVEEEKAEIESGHSLDAKEIGEVNGLETALNLINNHLDNE